MSLSFHMAVFPKSSMQMIRYVFIDVMQMIYTISSSFQLRKISANKAT